MIGGLEVLEGMLVLGLLTAPDVAAGQAHPQGRPAVAKSNTLLAHRRGWLDVVDHVQVSGELAGPDPAQEHVDQPVDHCHDASPPAIANAHHAWLRWS
jgi:hypothetical protein